MRGGGLRERGLRVEKREWEGSGGGSKPRQLILIELVWTYVPLATSFLNTRGRRGALGERGSSGAERAAGASEAKVRSG